MSSNNDGKNGYKVNPNGSGLDTFIKENEKLKNDVQYSGNVDAKILAKVFEEYSKDGLTNRERQKIEEFDKLLENAGIVINKEGTMATIVQDDGKSFSLKIAKPIPR